MGSNTSKPRKGHEHPHHLPKVGSPANEQWEQETHLKEHFRSPIAKIIFLVLFVGGVVGLLALTL